MKISMSSQERPVITGNPAVTENESLKVDRAFIKKRKPEPSERFGLFCGLERSGSDLAGSVRIRIRIVLISVEVVVAVTVGAESKNDDEQRIQENQTKSKRQSMTERL